jgi:triphosphatase
VGVPSHDAPGAVSSDDDVAADRNERSARNLRELLARRLNRWHRDVVADVARFATLDETERHRLRKRAKRLRYAAEFAASLFPGRAVKRYLKPLRAMQVLLGDLNDVAVAIQGYRALPPAEGPLFALGWLAARRDSLLAGSAEVLENFARARRFWR